MSDFQPEESWEDFVDDLVDSEIRRGNTLFDQLLKTLPGVWPPDVFFALQRLAHKKRIQEQVLLDAAQAKQKQGNRSCTSPNSHQLLLPAPHPLDFDWRFTDATVERLLTECLLLTGKGHRVAMIGSPSVFRAAIEQNYPRPLALLDANSSMIACLAKTAPHASVTCCDIVREPIPRFKASTIVADPPWYEEHILSFIWAACNLFEPAGHLFLSLPPIGTRPGMREERKRVLKFAQDEMQLNLVHIERGALAYETPYFERKTLEAAGFYNVPSDWRRGDLAIFRFEKLAPAVKSYRPPITPHQETDWVEESIDGLRVRLRTQKVGSVSFQDPSLTSVIEGDLFPSVSRRDTRRSLVNVWTSSNHVFACQGRNTLRYILQSLANGHRPENTLSIKYGRDLSSAEHHLVAVTTEKIIKLVEMNQEST